jgi:GAF domain-containing protein
MEYDDNKLKFYDNLIAQFKSLIDGENDIISNLSNASSLIFYNLPNLNWAGFYLFKDNQLVLGPFQGKTACIRINLGKGVCGTAAKEMKILNVPDVEKFKGHIACDFNSKSEIVIPIISKNNLFGVLDIDSPLKHRFDLYDEKGLEKFVGVFLENIK